MFWRPFRISNEAVKQLYLELESLCLDRKLESIVDEKVACQQMTSVRLMQLNRSGVSRFSCESCTGMDDEVLPSRECTAIQVRVCGKVYKTGIE